MHTKVALLELANLLNERDEDHAGPTQEQVLAYERAEVLVTAMEQTGRHAPPGYPATSNLAASPPATTSSAFSTLVPKRTALDEHVERAFDLLRHYHGFLVRTPGSAHDDDCESAMGQLETVLHRWLPLAFGASDPLISGVAAVVGDRSAAAALLRDADLWKARNDRLIALAEEHIPIDLSVPHAILVGRREVQHWLKLLPRVWSKPDGVRYVPDADRVTAKAPGSYWSSGVESRPSILGASYFLARACDAVARAGERMGIAVEVLRPAMHLALDLRRQPTWVPVEPPELPRHIDTLMGLANQVEKLLAEMELLSPRVDQRSQRNPDGDRAKASSNGLADAAPARATFNFTGSSEAAVTAVVRAVAELRKASPDLVPTKERIKEKAGKTGGAGDRAVKRAIHLGLLTPDYRMTDLGRRFLADRS
jgi:hypothetical protein